MSDNCYDINCTWEIRDFEKFMTEDGERYSPDCMYQNKRWRFQAKSIMNCLFNISFRCCTYNDSPIPSEKSIQFSVILPKRHRRIKLSLCHTIPPGIKISDFGSDYISRDESKPYVVEDILQIVCKLTEVQGQTEISVYESLLNSETLSDVKLFVDDVKFSAHKVVLYAHSPVFEKMFSHEMKESINNEVEIKEMSSEIFQELLRFMYTGKVNNLEEKAQDILIAANQYQIKGLILICSNFLCTKITLHSVVELLKLAVDHNASILKEYCFNFIILNYNDFITTEIYKDLLKTHPRSIADIAITIGLEYKLV